MSVPISIFVRDPAEFANFIADGSFSSQLEEGLLEGEELALDELKDQLCFLECVEGFKESLPVETKVALDRFYQSVFWSWGDTLENRPLDVRLNVECLDSSFSPGTSTNLLSCLQQVDWTNVESAFRPHDGFVSFAEFREYLDQWQSIFAKASTLGQTVFVFVFS